MRLVEPDQLSEGTEQFVHDLDWPEEAKEKFIQECNAKLAARAALRELLDAVGAEPAYGEAPNDEQRQRTFLAMGRARDVLSTSPSPPPPQDREAGE